jgi:hypothetical protein
MSYRISQVGKGCFRVSEVALICRPSRKGHVEGKGLGSYQYVSGFKGHDCPCPGAQDLSNRSRRKGSYECDRVTPCGNEAAGRTLGVP